MRILKNLYSLSLSQISFDSDHANTKKKPKHLKWVDRKNLISNDIYKIKSRWCNKAVVKNDLRRGLWKHNKTCKSRDNQNKSIVEKNDLR